MTFISKWHRRWGESRTSANPEGRNTVKAVSRELEGAALDWAVAYAKGDPHEPVVIRSQVARKRSYTTAYDIGMPIVEEHRIELFTRASAQSPQGYEWVASLYKTSKTKRKVRVYCMADSLLVAAMRTYVASVVGEVIDFPEEILK